MSVNEKFRIFKEALKTDEQGCLNLGPEAKTTEYRVLINEAGQILLDPVDNIPELERWLWQNPEAMDAVQRGLEQAARGEVYYLGEFAQYADF